jgi:hypothetical protein
MIHRINSEGLPSRTVAPRQQRAKGAYIVLWFRDCQRLSPLKNPKESAGESAEESAKESSVCSAEECDGNRGSLHTPAIAPALASECARCRQ